MPRLSMRTLGLAVIAILVSVQTPTPAQDVGKPLRPGKRQTNTGTQMNAPAIPPFGFIGYLATPRGRAFLRSSHHPLLRALAQRLGEPVDDQTVPPPQTSATIAATTQPDVVTSGCGGAAGTRFNLEPRVAPAVAPQNEPTVDFLPGAGLNGGDLVVGTGNDERGLFNGLGDSSTGYYVHRNGTSANPCSPDFDGGLPNFPSGATGEVVFAGGDAAIEADPARNAVFVVDTRIGLSVSFLGLFRNSAARLKDAAACPDGTHDGATAHACWPLHMELNPRTDGALNVFPQIAVDPRATTSGTGAGDVYVSNIVSTLSGVFTVLSACTNSLTACSPALVVSGADLRTQTTYVRVRPGGGITVTYVNIVEGPAPDFQQFYDIKYVGCAPQGAPNPPTCSAAKLIVREDQPVPSRGGGLGGGNLAAANFLITTNPKHENRQDGNGVETYVVWDRCKVPNIHGGDLCPDVDIRLAASNNNGASWTFANVDTGDGDQYFPAIRTDSSNLVNIAYMSAQGDGGMNHRSRVLLRQIAPGGATPDPVSAAKVITTLPMDPSGDFFFGDAYIGSYIGVASRSTATGKRAYIHYTHTAVNGIYNGVPAPEQNNHLSGFDY
jgi:hypothetical protein